MNYMTFTFSLAGLCHAFPIYPKSELALRPMTDNSEGGNSILTSHILKMALYGSVENLDPTLNDLILVSLYL